MGVDLFFVLSGYLMTQLLRRSTTSREFSMVDFWERRMRRLFPALLATVSFTLGLGFLILSPRELVRLAHSAIAQSLFAANIYFLRNSGGYFDGPAERFPLLHTWSLAVEEQFYLVLPFMLLALRRASDGRVMWIIGSLAAVSFLLSVCLLESHPHSTFYLLPTRAWELLVGSLLSMVPACARRSGRMHGLVAWVGLVLLFVCMIAYDDRVPFPGAFALAPVLCTVATLYSTRAEPKMLVSRFLSMPPLVFVGKVSYSWYLLHWPMLAFASIQTGPIGVWKGIFLSAASLCLAILSWRWIEQPFRDRTVLPGSRSLFFACAGGTMATMLVAIWFSRSGGVMGRFSNLDIIHLRDAEWIGGEYSIGVSDKHIPEESFPKLGRWPSNGEGRLDFLVWGDSHGAILSHLIDDVAKLEGLKGRAANTIGLPPLPNVSRPNYLDPRPTRVLRSSILYLLTNSPPKHLILVSRWGLYTSTKASSDDLLKSISLSELDDGGELTRDPDPMEQNRLIIKRSLSFLSDLCRAHGIRLWIVRQVPETAEYSAADAMIRQQLGYFPVFANERRSLGDHRAQQAAFLSLVDSLNSDSIHMIDPAPYLFDSLGFTVNYRGGRACYKDPDHMTQWGISFARPMVQSLMDQIKRESR